jgi:C1A family cysteine protease
MRYSQSSKFQYSLIFVLISVVIVLGISLSKSYGEEDQEFTLAPLSDSFLKYIEDLKSGKAVRVFTADGYPLGAIPDPVDCRSLINSPAPDLIGQLPLQYDLRTKNKLTPIKNQGSCGSCWAFASMGALESSLMPKERRDFSEQHLINTHGFDYSTCEGGSRFMAVAYLARWAGPLNEADKPYIYSLASTASKIRKHVQNVTRKSNRL